MPLPNLLRRLFGREEPPDIPRQSAAPSPSKEDALHRAVAVIRRLREECRTDDRVRIEAAIAEATNSGVDPEELKDDLRAAHLALQVVDLRQALAAGEDLPVVEHLGSGDPCYFKARHVWRGENDNGTLTMTDRGIIFDGNKVLSAQWQKIWTLEPDGNYLNVDRTSSDRAYEFRCPSESEGKLAHLVGVTLWKRVSAEAESKKTRGRKAKPARSGSGEATPSPEESSTTDALVGSTIEFPSSGPFPVAVVGESRRQATLKQLAGTRLTHGESVVFTAAVVPEPKNSFDPNAIAIYVHGGGQVGYLAREDALELKAVSQALLAQKSIGLCRARLIGGTENKPSIGVMLDLADCQTLLDHISPAGAPF